MKGNSLSSNPREYYKGNNTILNVSTGSSEIKPKRFLSPIDADIIFVQLTGSKFRNDCNSRNASWNKRIMSPSLKRPSYLGKFSAINKIVDSK